MNGRFLGRGDSLDERHISANYGLPNPRLADISRISAADVLIAYMRNNVPRQRRPTEAAARIRRLSEFFGAKMLPEINGSLCREYVAMRSAVQAARRELADLRAAINEYFADELIRPTIRIEMPPAAAPRERWMTEAEAATLLRTAWRKCQAARCGGKHYVARHIARFILVGLYTGTRSSAICGAALRPTIGRGYVDLQRGVFYRRPPGAKETNKRQPSARLPDKLLNHIRRWERLGLCKNFIVEWEGEPVKRISKAFKQIAIEAGLPDVTPHTLRHTAISWALQRGTKAFDVADYFGVSEEVIKRTYGHHDPEHHREVTARMDRRRTCVAPGFATSAKRALR